MNVFSIMLNIFTDVNLVNCGEYMFIMYAILLAYNIIVVRNAIIIESKKLFITDFFVKIIKSVNIQVNIIIMKKALLKWDSLINTIK